MTRLTMTADFFRLEMPVLKKRGYNYNARMAVVPRGAKAKCHEDKMMDYVLKYFKNFSGVEQPLNVYGRAMKRPATNDMYLMRACQLETTAKKRTPDGRWIDTVIRKPLHPHYLRHVRAHHLTTYYNFTDTKLRQYFNWSDERMAARYTRFGDVESYF